MSIHLFKKRKKQIVTVFVVALLFVVSSYLSIHYKTYFEEVVAHKSAMAAFFYVLITVLAVILAPGVSTLPLLPIASSIWGPFMAAVFTIASWMLGAWGAFALSRIFGYAIICKIFRIKEEKWRKRLPRENLFWLVVFARIFLPVDILSYVIGLFTDMRLSAYLLATLIGVTPFAFLFSYGAQLPVDIQLLAFVSFLFVAVLNYRLIKKGVHKMFKNWF